MPREPSNDRVQHPRATALTGQERHGLRRPKRASAEPGADPPGHPARRDPPVPDPEVRQRSPSSSPSPWPRARCFQQGQPDRDSRSAALHGSARHRHRARRRRRQRHKADVCRDRSSRPHLGSPRRGSLHPRASRDGIPARRPPFPGQSRIRQQLVGKRHPRHCGVTTKLVGHPPRERQLEALDDRHDVFRNADRLVWHVRMIHT